MRKQATPTTPNRNHSNRNNSKSSKPRRNGHTHVNGNHPSPSSSKGGEKGKLDTITFIYGFGAAVVLVGAMFKFLGWPFANELFIVGLSIEAVVFLISAFERKEEDIDYKWENVFPQLQDNQGALNGHSTNDYSSAMEQFAYTLKEMTYHIQDLSTSLQEIKGSMQDSAESSQEMQSQMGEFNELMDRYNENLRFINDRYDEVIR